LASLFCHLSSITLFTSPFFFALIICFIYYKRQLYPFIMVLGNPAPLGLLAFGMTTAMLMYVEMGWAEVEFEQLIFGYAVFLGGICQILVAIFEIMKGSSFSFAVFGCYGAFWLGWGLVYVESNRTTSTFDASLYPDGKVAWLIQWGVLSACFWLITLRKNLCLIAVFALLTSTFFLLAVATATGSEGVKKAGGYVGFLTAIGAWYTGVAELINEEYGQHILPGLTPIKKPERFNITKESIATRISYVERGNTLFLTFRGLQIKTSGDILAIYEGVEEAIKATNAPGGKVHVVVDYKDVYLAEDKFDEYWAMVDNLERQYYLSASRFHVSSFGTVDSGGTGGIGLRKALDTRGAYAAPGGPKERVSSFGTVENGGTGGVGLRKALDTRSVHAAPGDPEAWV
jgi:succinate-acetate transporter protein